MTERYDHHVYQGETYEHTFPVLYDDNDDPLDLTQSGYAADAEIKEHHQDDATVDQWSDGSEFTLNDDGTIDLKLTASTTAGYEFDEVVYDLKLTHPDGSVTYPFQGHILLDHAVTTS